jgi:transcriptional regulator with XRE-family HTH domain
MEKETVGQRIKRLRKEKKISVIEIANAIGVSRSNFYRYENGEVEKMPYKTLIPIAKYLNVSPAYLLNGKKEPKNNYNMLIKRIIDTIGDTTLTDDEMSEITSHIQYIIFKRK